MTDLPLFLQLDAPALATALLAAISCGLLGNFLVLRRESLVGDAISHVVLLGVVAGFLISGTNAALPTVLGALISALAATFLIHLLRTFGRVEPGAAMGVVFTTMFALGVLLLEVSGAREVHIDVQHALYGNLEGTVWLDGPPDALVRLVPTTLLIAAVISLLFKELKLATFDHAAAALSGFRPGLLGALLAILTALAAVMSFAAVGSIIVIAMFVCPAATARLLTDDLGRQIGLSVALAAGAASGGYVLAAFGPGWLGFDAALSAAGMIATLSGLGLGAAALFAPRYGAFAARRPVALTGSRAPVEARPSVEWGGS